MSTLANPPAAVLNHHPLGLSTGCIAERRGEWDELVERAAAAGSFAVELAALSEWELDGLLTYLSGGSRLPFRYISVHGPSKSLEMPEEELVATLARTPGWVQSIVVHPDTMEEPARYARLGRRLVIENMDARKSGGRTADELRPLFEALPEAGFCFDVAHAWSIDTGLAVARGLLDAFRTRLRQVHLSSLDESLKHVALTPADEKLFAPLLRRCRDVPWILEAEMSL